MSHGFRGLHRFKCEYKSLTDCADCTDLNANTNRSWISRIAQKKTNTVCSQITQKQPIKFVHGLHGLHGFKCKSLTDFADYTDLNANRVCLVFQYRNARKIYLVSGVLHRYIGMSKFSKDNMRSVTVAANSSIVLGWL